MQLYIKERRTLGSTKPGGLVQLGGGGLDFKREQTILVQGSSISCGRRGARAGNKMSGGHLLSKTVREDEVGGGSEGVKVLKYDFRPQFGGDPVCLLLV